jgi:stalled ribosome alternative rescue factor ArfA
MKTVTMKIKVNVWELPNKMHFEVQKATRAHVFTPKKGCGSFTRKIKHKENYINY